MQARSAPASLIIRFLTSIVELQRQLDVSWRLSARNLAHAGANTHARCIVLNMIEGVDEVRAELQPESFGNRKVLMQAEIDVTVMRRPEVGELRRAIAERSDCWLRDLSIVDEPLPANAGNE